MDDRCRRGGQSCSQSVGRKQLLDLLDGPFGGPVLLPSFGGRQVEGLGLAF